MPDNNAPDVPFEDLLSQSNFHFPGKPTLNVFAEAGTAPTINPKMAMSNLLDGINAVPQGAMGAQGGETFSPLEVDTSGRYPSQRLGGDNEDLYAQGQSWGKQAFNGVTKGLIIAGTTFAQGTIGTIAGLEQVVTGHGLHSFYDNDLSNLIQSWNDSAENALPNYYSAKERSAEWWQPANLFTANFVWDKLVKNVGFSLGAIYSGAVVAKGIGLLKGLIPALDVSKAASTAAQLEKELSAVPPLQRWNYAQNIIRSASDKFNSVAGLANNATAERFLVSTLGAATEGGIEALQGVNDFRNSRIREYTEANGYAPLGGDLDKINDAASSLGNARFGLNMALLTATNYIQLPKILGSTYKDSKAIANTAAGEIGGVRRNAEGLLERALPTTKFGRYLSKASNVGGLIFAPSEAFEEGAQYAIQKGVEDYYSKAYKGEGRDFLQSLGKGWGDAFNDKEGMESILLGGVSGGLQQIRGNIKERGITGTGGTRGANTERFISQANANPLNLSSESWTKEMATAAARGVSLMHEQESFIRQGDVLEVKDNEMDQIHNYLAPRIKYGRYDLVKEDIADFKNMASTQAGLDALKAKGYAAASDTLATFSARLTNFEKHAENINSLFNSLNLRYGGKNSGHTEGTIDQMVYAASKIADYDDRIPQLAHGLTQKYNINLGEIIAPDIFGASVKKDAVTQVIKEINELTRDSSGDTITSDDRDELKSNLRDIIELSARRKEFLKEYEDIKARPDEYKNAVLPQRVDEIILPQKLPSDGRKSVQTPFNAGQEYSLRTPVTREGNSIILAPKITPLDNTLGTEIEAVLPTGKTQFIPKNNFKQYQLSTFNNASKEIEDKFKEAVPAIIKTHQFRALQDGFRAVDKNSAQAIQDFVNEADSPELADEIVKALRPIIKEQQKKAENERKAAEELQKNEKVKKELEDLQKRNDNKTGFFGPDDPSIITLEEEDESNKYAKAPIAAFLSKEADFYDKNNPKPHQQRRLSFMTNIAAIQGTPEAARVKVLAVTKKNEEAYGLKGLRDWVVNDIKNSGLSQETFKKYFDGNELKPEHEPIIKLYIIKDKGKLFLADVKGNKLSELAGDVTNEVTEKGIFGLFHSDLTGVYAFGPKEGKNNYVGNEKDFERARAQYAAWRTRILNKPDSYHYDIQGISRGIVLRDEENKPVTSTPLAKESDLSKEGIIVVPSIAGDVTINNVSLNFPLGIPLLKNGSNVEFLNNRKFTPQEALTVFNVIKEVAKNKMNAAGLRAANYLNSVLYMRSPVIGEPILSHQVFVREGQQHFGPNLTVPFTELSLDTNKGAILSYFENYYVKTNNKMLTQDLYEEAYTNSSGDVAYRSHPTYSEYLLSAKDKVPFLQVKARRQLDENDPVIISRYSTLAANEFEFVAEVQPKSTKPPVISEDEATEGVGEIAREEDAFAPGFTFRKKQSGPVDKKADIERRRQEELKPLERWRAALNNESKAREAGTSLHDWNAGVEREIKKLEDRIAKYDAELAALSATITPPKAPSTGGPTFRKGATAKDIEDIEKKAKERGKKAKPDDLNEFKMADELQKYVPIDLNKEIAYIKAKSPFSVDILDNIIRTPQGLHAWGQYKNMAIGLYQQAIAGTGYHELFEGVWKAFLTPDEQYKMMREFQARKGNFTFFDGQLYHSIPYSNATQFQIKETLADEFAKYVSTKQQPKESLIARWFNNLWNFIKSIFSGEVRIIDKIFAGIDAAKYKSLPASSMQANDAEYSLADLSYLEQYQTIRGVALQVIQEMINPNKPNSISITEFEESDESVRKFYADVYNSLDNVYNNKLEGYIDNPEQIEALKAYWNNIKQDWNLVTQLTSEYLKTFSIIEGESAKDRERNPEYYDDAKYFQNDAKNTASRSIKLLIATLPESIFDAEGVLWSKRNSTFMQEQVNYAKTFNGALYKIADLNTYKEKEDKLVELGQKIPNFKRLYDRLTLRSNSSTPNSVLNDWKLKVRFFNVMSKQVPSTFIQFNQPDGTSYTGTRNLDSSIKLTTQGWIDNLKNLALSGNSTMATITEDGNLVIVTRNINDNVRTPADKINYLSQLQIPFTLEMFNRLSPQEQQQFNDAVVGLRNELTKRPVYPLDDIQAWRSAGNMQNLAISYINAGNDFESSFYNMEGESQTKFISTNKISRDVNDVNNTINREELFETMPQLRQVEDSMYLNNLLFDGNGRRKQLRLELGYIQGTLESSGRPFTGDNLSVNQRLTQEINQNLNERYYVLVPADSKTQWMLQMANPVTFKNIAADANDWRTRMVEKMTEYYNTEKTSYNALKDILSEKDLAKRSGAFKELSHNYTMSDVDFHFAINEFIEIQVGAQKRFFEGYNTISESEGKYTWKGLDKEFLTREKLNHRSLSSTDVNNILTFRTVNYMINNVEMHKLFFGDILQYSDEKRYKLFLSPREISMHSEPEFNNHLNKEYNKAGKIQLESQLVGRHMFSDNIKTNTMNDVIGFNEELAKIDKAYGSTVTTDASAISSIVGMRERRIKGGTWTEKDEQQYQYMWARDRQLMLKDNVLSNFNYPKALQEQDEEAVEKGNPNVAYVYVEKPIVSGHTAIDGVYSPIVDKFSIVSYSYAAVRDTNLRDHYIKMLKQDIGYLIVKSGRKVVGSTAADNFYTVEGEVDREPYSAIISVPFSTFGVQSDTSSKKENQTRGTQITKLITINLYNAGVPVSQLADDLVKKDRALLDEQTKIGYDKLLKQIGAEDVDGKYRIVNKKKILQLVTDELLRRDVADSIKQQLQLTSDGQLKTAFEALPNYTQIKQILYAHVDKAITSPKVSGGPKVQVSGALMESYGIKRQNVNGKPVYTSAGLKFYTKDEPWMEVLMPFSFGKMLRKAGLKWKDEQELMELIKKSPDAQRILAGVGFRIPTQELNSMENFRIKGFLPEEMGDTIVVPEEITTKAGSDFDIDKLNTYLQNLYVDSKGNIRIVPYFGIGEAAKAALKKHFTEDELKKMFQLSAKDKVKAFYEDQNDINIEEDERDIDVAYRQSIENEYFKNMQDILALPENFKRLVTPNTADNLKDIRNKLVNLAPYEFSEGVDKGIVSPMYMLNIRHNGISGKKLIGISALAQTGTSVSQRSPVVVDFEKIPGIAWRDRNIIGKNPKILLPHNDVDGLPTISKIKDREDVYISDKISQYINGTVDIFKDAFLPQINFNSKTAGVYLMLERLGVPNSSTHPIVSLFMNQPIIREFVKFSDVKEVKNLLNLELIALFRRNVLNTKFKTSLPRETYLPEGKQSLTDLLTSSIEGYYNGRDFSQKENAIQQLIFNEYLKYSVYSQQLFQLQQATNYDTANLNDNYALNFKERDTAKALESNIWSSPEAYLSTTFIGGQRTALGNATDTLSDVLVINNPITQRWLRPILNVIAKKFISNDDKLYIARKMEESLLNHLIHTIGGTNNSIKSMMIDKETALVNQLREIKKALKVNEDFNSIRGNVILQQLMPYIKGKSATSTKNITLAVKARDVFTKNLYNASFKELLDNPITAKFANDLVTLSFIQNGVSNSAISYKDAIPADVYSNVMKEIIPHLLDTDALSKFVQTGGFFRNSVGDTDIVPEINNRDYNLFATNSRVLEYANKLNPNTKAPLTIWYPSYRNEPYLVHLNYVDLPGEEEPVLLKTLFKRVENEIGIGVVEDRAVYSDEQIAEGLADPSDTDKTEPRALYIQVNAWGDGMRAQEYYDSPRPSVFSNGYQRLETELDDVPLANFLHNYEVSGITPEDVPPTNPNDNNDIQDKLDDCLPK